MFNIINSSNLSLPNGNNLQNGTSFNQTLYSHGSTTIPSASYNGSSSLMHTNITEQHSNQRKVPLEILEALCNAFRKNTCSLNSPTYKINQTEFAKVISSLQCYKSTFPVSCTLMWLLERGESSAPTTQNVPSESQSTHQLVCFVVSSDESHQVLGKMVIQNPEKKFIIRKSSHLSLCHSTCLTNLILLKNMRTLSSAGVRDQFQVPAQHKKLADLFTPTAIATRHQLFGVVSHISKIPTAPVPPKKYWHSIIYISDPSLLSETEEPAASFKMNVFMISGEDFPEIHRGDVVRFTNVKVELEFNNYDGRIFKKDEIAVYCYWDIQSPVPREDNEERATVVRVLSRWWSLNSQHFDSLTPRPIYHTYSKYPGVRCLREVSNHLVFDIYCQVTGVSDNSNERKILYTRDGTIFTTLEEKKFASGDHIDNRSLPADELKPSYGYLALVVFDINHWKKIEALKIVVGDYLLLKGVRVVFCEKENFTTLGSTYPFQYPCVLLRPAPYHDSDPKKIMKIRANHHEAAKIQSRLHRLPEALEEMKLWKPLPAAEDEEAADSLLAELMNPAAQLQLLSNLKR